MLIQLSVTHVISWYLYEESSNKLIFVLNTILANEILDDIQLWTDMVTQRSVSDLNMEEVAN